MAAATAALSGCSALAPDSGTVPFHDGDWHSFANGPTNPNRVPGGAPESSEGSVLAGASWPYAPPAVHDGVAYFVSEREGVAVTVDGVEQWSQSLEGELSGAPAIDPARDRLYVPTRIVPATSGPDPAPAFVAVLSLGDGSVRDRYRVGTRRTYGVTVVDGAVYVRSATACVKLAPDGTERWRRSLDPLVYDEYNLGDFTATQVAPAVTGDGVYVPDRDALVKLDPDSGRERWRVAVDTAYAAPVVADDGGVVQTGHRETVAVDPGGEERWRRSLGTRAAAAAADDVVYVVPGDVHELDLATGETNWQAHVPSEGTAAPVVTDESVLVVSGDVRAYRREVGGLFEPDRLRWRTSSVHAHDYASPVIAAGRAFVVGPMGLQALRPGSTDG
ncbi:PQQ-binding-like beta-propeller repeat protein [Halomicroarcula sp. GCM10025817]|uniref:outer membrane protein assembly factor BamB family protein n=1 Tax=Haloarcula TaxID=2237 RepID=UPI0023E797D2|nr:PQQ-binding-like beta-propeller repeat protein [Halomicroarcula sp. SYNS111]